MQFAKLCSMALAAMLCWCAPVSAQEAYPSRLITIVVPITPGTTIDILARLYADKLAKKFGQQVVVANRPGAGGLIAAQAVANAPADGYTILFANSGHAILGTLNKNLPFDPVRDFAGVSLVGEAPTVVTVAPSLGVSNLKEFVEMAKAKPGSVNYGSAGIGTATHLAGAYFALKTNTELVHVPYTVSATIIADLMGGRIQASFVPMAFVLPLLQDGRLRALAVSSNEPITEPRESADGAVPGDRLPERHLVRRAGARQDAAGRAQGAARGDRGSEQGSRLAGEDPYSGNQSAEHRARQVRCAYSQRHGAARAAVAVDQRGALKPALSFFRRVFLAVRPACAVLMPERHTRSRT